MGGAEHLVSLAEAGVTAGHADIGQVRVEPDLDQVHDVVVAHLEGGLPGAVVILVDLRERLLDQHGEGGGIAQADAAVIAHGVRQQGAEGSHLGGIRIAGTGCGLDQHAHVELGVVGDPVVDDQILLNGGHVLVQLCQAVRDLLIQQAAVALLIGHVGQGHQFHVLVHDGIGHVVLGIGVQLGLEGTVRGVLRILGGPEVAGRAEVLGEGAGESQHLVPVDRLSAGGHILPVLKGAVVAVVGAVLDGRGVGGVITEAVLVRQFGALELVHRAVTHAILAHRHSDRNAVLGGQGDGPQLEVDGGLGTVADRFLLCVIN